MKNFKNKLDCKMVLLMFVLLQIIIPVLVSAKAFFIDGENYLQTLKEGFIICFFFLCFIFYIPLVFKLFR